jgi:hypothetical protein
MQLGGAALAPRVGLQSSGSGIKRVADRDVDVGMRGMLAGLVHFDKGCLRAFGTARLRRRHAVGRAIDRKFSARYGEVNAYTVSFPFVVMAMRHLYDYPARRDTAAEGLELGCLLPDVIFDCC